MSGPLRYMRGGSAIAVSDMQSALFNGVDEYQSFELTANGNADTWTLSLRVFRCEFGRQQVVWAGTTGVASNRDLVLFQADDTLAVVFNAGTLTTTGVYRDTGWLYIDVRCAAGTLTVYVNGEEVLSGVGASLQRGATSGNFHRIGYGLNADYFNGYLAQVLFLDGVAEAVTNLGRVHNQGNASWWYYQDETALQPLADAAGGNSYYLDFQALSTDASTNGNDFTATNMDASNLSLHSPANPYALLNHLDPLTTGTLSNGNLTVAGGNATVTLQPEDDGTVYYFENGGVGQTTTDPAALVLTAGTYNFGATPFSDTGPAVGQKLLRHSDMPQPGHQGADHFNALIRTGTAEDVRISGAGFDPDLLLILNRTALNTDDHKVVDQVRGATKELLLSTAAAEADQLNGVMAFPAGGYDLQGNAPGYNDFGESFVDWLIREGTVLDIVTHTGDASATQAVAHSLGVAPALILTTQRSAPGGPWYVYHSTVGALEVLTMDTNAAAAATDIWGDTAPTSTQFTVGGSANTNGATYVSYLFRDLSGVCRAFGYAGDGAGAAGGPIIHLGFRPRAWFVKRTDLVEEWHLYDTARQTTNPVSTHLKADLPDGEVASGVGAFDVLHGGLKTRENDPGMNAVGGSYIGFAWGDAASGGALPPLPGGFPVDLDAVTADVPATVTTDPSLTGTVKVGETLTFVDGTLDGTAPVNTTLREVVNNNDGATTLAGTTYVIPESAYGDTLSPRQTAGNAAGSDVRTGPSVGPVAASDPGFGGGQPTASSGNKAGDTVTITSAPAGSFTGFPAPTHVQYDIYRTTGAVLIQADIASGVYTLPAGEIGNQYFIRQTISNPAGSVTADSPNYGPITAADAAPVNTVAPAITPASVEAGNVLTCSTGTWTGSPTPTFSYQWRNGGVNIPGQTANTYTTVNPDDVSDTIDCIVTADNGVGSPVAAEASNDVVPSAPAGGGSWVPTDLGSKLHSWHDATDAATVILDGSSNVERWEDKSGNAHHLKMDDVANRASYVTGQYIETVKASEEGFEYAAADVPSGNAVFIFMVVHGNTTPDLQTNWAYDGIRLLWQGQNGSTFAIPSVLDHYWLDGVDQAAAWTDRNDIWDNIHVGTPLLTALDCSNFTFGSLFQFMRYQPFGGTSVEGRAYELIITDTALTTDERQDIEGYLAHKHGIESRLDAGHPHKGSAP